MASLFKALCENLHTFTCVFRCVDGFFNNRRACVCVCLECEIHLRNDNCFSHASNEPKRPPATGDVCVSYTASPCGNWISRDEFDSRFAHSLVLAGVLRLQNRSQENCRSVSISSLWSGAMHLHLSSPALVLRRQIISSFVV